MPTFGVPQISLEGSRDQNLRGGTECPPVQSRVNKVNANMINFIGAIFEEDKGYGT